MTSPCWSPENQEKLSRFLSAAKSGSVAVFDFDNTVIHNDIGEAVLEFMALNNLINWEALFAEKEAWSYGGLRGLRGFYKKDKKRLGIAVIARYQYLCRCFGKKIGYPWAAQILAGHSPRKIRAVTKEVMAFKLKQKIGKQELAAHVVINTGLRVHEPMAELIAAMQDKKIEVWFVSASNQWSVEELAQNRFHVPAERVLGMRPLLRRGLISAVFNHRRYPITYRRGKVQTIQKNIGRRPVFAAGDSPTDWEMLLYASRCKLFFDHGNPRLARQIKKRQKEGEQWLIQRCYLKTDN